MKKDREHNKQGAYIILIFFGILIFSMGILNHYFFRTVTFDYGNYNFAFWDYSHFRISPMPTYSGNFLQDHYSFTLMYFVPVYWILNWLTGTYTIILIQSSFVIIAGWYTYEFILLKTDNMWMGIGVLIYYFTLLGRYTTFSCDANIAVISACFIPIFIYYFHTRKYLVSFIILLLSLLSRENIPIWFIFIFVVLIIENRKDTKAVTYCLFGILFSLVYFVLLFKVLIPLNESEEKRFTLFNYSALGSNPGEALIYMISHPIESIKLFFVNHLDNSAYDGVKAEFYWVYFISGGIIIFFRPKYLIWFIPIVAQKVLNDSFVRWGISTYYSIEVVTLLPISVFLTLSAIKQTKIQNILILITCIITLSTTIYKLDRNHCKIPWGLNPDKEKIYDKRFWTTKFDIPKVNKLLSQIPSNANISASDRFFSHLAQRPLIHLFPKVNDAEYIVFSLFDDNFMISHEENEECRNKYLNDPQWDILKEEFPVFLLKKKNPLLNEKSKNSTLFFSKSDTLICNYEKIDENKKHVLFFNNERADTILFLSSEKFHSSSHSIKLSPENQFSSVIKINNTEQLISLQINVWCYCQEELRANIIANCGKDFYYYTNKEDTIDDSGWKKLKLNFFVPKNKNITEASISLWNSGSSPAYFDDLQIIKRYKE